jgi:Zn-dependent protease
MDFLNGSFRVARLFGIDIRVHILFAIWIGYRLLSARQHWEDELLFTTMLFGVVLLHELGHCFGARAVGGDARHILMWPLGGLAYADAPMRPWPQFVTVAAGPAVNVVLCLACAVTLIASTGHVEAVSLNPFSPADSYYFTERWQGYVALLYWINLFLLYFNLLPVYPFDGGQLFRAIIWPHVGLQRATIVAAQLGIIGAIALGFFGVTREDFLLMSIALFGGITSYQQMQAARSGMLAEEFMGADRVLREKSGPRGWWARWRARRRSSRIRPGPTPHGRPTPNPNPGAWEARISERDRLEAEVDRILKKVSERGIHSLSYTERQTLERATRERQQREREFEHDTRL